MPSPEAIARSSALVAYMTVVFATVCVVWFQPHLVMKDDDPKVLDIWKAVGYIFVAGFFAFGCAFMYWEYQ